MAFCAKRYPRLCCSYSFRFPREMSKYTRDIRRCPLHEKNDDDRSLEMGQDPWRVGVRNRERCEGSCNASSSRSGAHGQGIPQTQRRSGHNPRTDLAGPIHAARTVSFCQHSRKDPSTRRIDNHRKENWTGGMEWRWILQCCIALGWWEKRRYILREC